jgi:methionyl-tRNA formyltransferase
LIKSGLNKILNIGYFADGPWAHQALQKMFVDTSLQVGFICARHDRPDQVLKEMAREKQIPFLTHSRINSSEFRNQLNKYECDLFVSMSFNQIFRRELFEMPPLRTINCHAGKLPFYRGRNILNWALLNDEAEFGITVHYIDEGIDTGDILLQQSFPITDADTYRTLLERAYTGCAELLHLAILQLLKGTSSPKPQSEIHPVGFYCCVRQEGDEILDWYQPSRDVFNFVRAICLPGPQARTFLRGREMRIERLKLIPQAPEYHGIPGVVVGLGAGEFIVKTADSTVSVEDWAFPERIRIGDRLQSII